MAEGGEYLIQRQGHWCSEFQYRLIWKGLTERSSIPGTPHSWRHTFESLLDSAGANRKCIGMIMGHGSKDTGNRTYNHKNLKELQAAVELVQRKIAVEYWLATTKSLFQEHVAAQRVLGSSSFLTSKYSRRAWGKPCSCPAWTGVIPLRLSTHNLVCSVICA